jgi:hypothetical protein
VTFFVKLRHGKQDGAANRIHTRFAIQKLKVDSLRVEKSAQQKIDFAMMKLMRYSGSRE